VRLGTPAEASFARFPAENWAVPHGTILCIALRAAFPDVHENRIVEKTDATDRTTWSLFLGRTQYLFEFSASRVGLEGTWKVLLGHDAWHID
jgi:hypothetical protein